MQYSSINKFFSFKILHKDRHSKARIGRLTTSKSFLDTPAFVPVGTQATVKSLTPDDLNKIGVGIVFGNTYHLHLSPGEEVIKKLGGLGKFMGFKGITMTDSGGFQVFSLARGGNRFNPKENNTNNKPKMVKISEDGVEFTSHLDGSKHFFTPEKSIKIQKKLGADIILAFDDCPPFPVHYDNAKKAMEITHKWLERSIYTFKNSQGKFDQVLYPIVQGSVFKDLRKESANFIRKLDTDGIAIGGVAVGEGKEEMLNSVGWVQNILPEEKIKHLLGVGDIDDIFKIVELGIDTFDCVTPTRLGRVGTVFISPPYGNIKNRFRIDITKGIYAGEGDPLSINCSCYVCHNFSIGYINHLFRSKELLAYRLATYHNIFFITDLVKKIRESIVEGNFGQLKEKWLI